MRTLGNTQMKTSLVAHGTWAAGGTHWGATEDQACIDAIRESLDKGVALVDTAPIYGAGHSEEMVGLALEGRRDEVLISTKCGLLIDDGGRHSLTPKDIHAECDASLSRLKTDRIDIYFCHWPDKEVPIEESIGGLMALKEAGKIRGIGLSNHSPELIRRACAAGDVCCLQEHYSLLRRRIENGLTDLARELGLGIMAYAPLGGGILTGKYTEPPAFEGSDVRNFFYPFYKEPLWSRTQDLLAVMRGIAAAHECPVHHVAIAWVNARPAITCALVGAKNVSQAAGNAGAGGLVLEDSEVAALTAASDAALEESA
jgi:aryl-alcohol dehydrogenase-like predicted oxidoreductase